jgi:voltage-gated potassium channel
MPAIDAWDQLKQRARRILALVAAVLAIGTIGYRLISHGESGWIDCLYMVVITVATIGYSEVIPLDHSPVGRVFTMFVALFGIGIITYVMSTITQVAVDGDLQRRWRRRIMQKAIEQLRDHYLVCGWGDLTPAVLAELRQTQRPAVLVVPDRSRLDRTADEDVALLVIEGEPADDDTLRKAGIERAAGVFAMADEDHTNIVICMAAHSLNPAARIVAAVRDPKNAPKVRKAGAGAAVSPTEIGALRITSEMVRPAVVSFLDSMLRDRKKNLRVENVRVGDRHGGRALREFNLDAFASSVLLAVSRAADWVFKPSPDHTLKAGDTLVFMTNPSDRQRLEDLFK